MNKKTFKEEILIVDDEEDVCFLLCRILRKKGFDPTACSSLEQTKQEISKHNYDIILLDINLKDGNGLSLLEEQLIPDSSKVVVMSARNDMADLAISLGASSFVAKPFNRNRLFQIIDENRQ